MKKFQFTAGNQCSARNLTWFQLFIAQYYFKKWLLLKPPSAPGRGRYEMFMNKKCNNKVIIKISLQALVILKSTAKSSRNFMCFNIARLKSCEVFGTLWELKWKWKLWTIKNSVDESQECGEALRRPTLNTLISSARRFLEKKKLMSEIAFSVMHFPLSVGNFALVPTGADDNGGWRLHKSKARRELSSLTRHLARLVFVFTRG